MQELLKTPDFIVLNKSSGVLMYKANSDHIVRQRGGVSEAYGCTVAEYLGDHYPETLEVGDNPKQRPGMVHRLDRETSGVLLIARNAAVFDCFKKQFQERTIHKEYLAMVYGLIKGERIVTAPIGLVSGTTRHSTRARHMKMIKPALTEIYPISSMAGESPVSFVRAVPKTGRTHQIRVHLASIGHPVIGDRLYGPKKQLISLGRLFLHSAVLEFSALDGQRIRVEALLPPDLLAALSRAGFSEDVVRACLKRVS